MHRSPPGTGSRRTPTGVRQRDAPAAAAFVPVHQPPFATVRRSCLASARVRGSSCRRRTGLSTRSPEHLRRPSRRAVFAMCTYATPAPRGRSRCTSTASTRPSSCSSPRPDPGSSSLNQPHLDPGTYSGTPRIDIARPADVPGRTPYLINSGRALMALQPVARITLALAAVAARRYSPPPPAPFSRRPPTLTVGGSNPQVATDATGDSAVAWEFTGNRVQARTSPRPRPRGPSTSRSGARDDRLRRRRRDRLPGRRDLRLDPFHARDFVLARPLSAAGSSVSGSARSGNSGSFNTRRRVGPQRRQRVLLGEHRRGNFPAAIQARTMSPTAR